MTTLSRIQGFRLCGTNRKELLTIRVLVGALVLALVNLVQALVALVKAHADLVQALVVLVHPHPPQGELIWLVRRQVVMGPGFGLVGPV